MICICMLVTSELDHDPRVQKEARLAVEAGYKVVVICRSYTGGPLPYSVVTLKTKRRSTLMAKYFERIWSNVCLIYYAIKQHPNIVHANDLDTLAAGYIASRLTRARLVYDAHELWCDVTQNIGSLGRKLAFLVEKFISRRADAVVAASGHRAQIMSDKLGIKTPTAVMNTPYYVDSSKLHPAEWVKDFAGRKIVLFQGIYSPGRGLREAVLAIKQLPNNVILAFRGYGPLENELRQFVTDECVQDRVFFLPPVPMNDLVSSAVGADIGLVLYEPVNQNNIYAAPNKMFEYIMAGVPCVGSDLPYIRHILCTYQTGEVFEPNDPTQMAKTIRELIASPEKLETMSRNCHEVSNQFCWEAEGKKLMQIYDQILA